MAFCLPNYKQESGPSEDKKNDTFLNTIQGDILSLLNWHNQKKFPYYYP